MRSYPIWNKVQACIYKGKKSFGAREFSETEILVGSSKDNSYQLAKISTKRKEVNFENFSEIHFEFRLDNKLIRTMVFENNDDRAGEFKYTQNH